MRILNLPCEERWHYARTGKFKAPSANWKHELFTLEDYELIVMTEGTMYLSYNGENFTVKQGEYLLLPPSDSWRQGFRNAYCSFYWLHFETNNDYPLEQIPDIKEDDNALFSIPQTGSIPQFEKMVVLMKQLQDKAKNKYPAIALDSMTKSILTELYGQLCLTPPLENSAISKKSGYKQIHSDIIDYIQRNISSPIKISEIAAHFGYNEKYISHLFAEITGTPLKQFILGRKIDAANFMLTDTNMAITDIAKELGFSDSHNFSRAYKNFTGLTPSEYRNAYAGRILFFK